MPDFASFVRSTRPLLISAVVVMRPGTVESASAALEVQAPSGEGGVVVAALSFTPVHIRALGCPGDPVCAVETLVRDAHRQGARLVVAPEYGLPQTSPEPDPKVGDRPDDLRSMPLLTRLARLSRELGIYLVVDLETERGKEGFNALVALSPDGRVVGVHHKFELFEGERGALTPGDDVDAFDTPFGRVGLLVCADVYGAVRLHERLARDLDVDIVAYSAAWTVEGATHWPSAFAHDWGVFVVAANGSTGEGRGSGVFDRKGAALALSNRFGSPVIVARLPVEPLAGDSGKRGTR